MIGAQGITAAAFSMLAQVLIAALIGRSADSRAWFATSHCSAFRAP